MTRFDAHRLGAAYVTRNLSLQLLEGGALCGDKTRFRPVVYCWRGGLRSRSTATVLSMIGYEDVVVLEGGYKAFRGLVREGLAGPPHCGGVARVCGRTGVGKTLILEAIGRIGKGSVQAVDLEALARHRGSIFGSWQVPQPTQKGFETELWSKLSMPGQLGPETPLFLESEGRKIGELTVPPALYAAIHGSPRWSFKILLPLAHRVKHLVHEYKDMASVAPERLAAKIAHLAPLHPGKLIAHWKDLAMAGSIEQLVQSLLENHYDALYDRFDAEKRGDVEIPLQDLSPASLESAARAMIDTVLHHNQR
jgi:tRNA 2-selenouridine synthase